MNRRLLILAALAAPLMACGKKGRLRLPDEEDEPDEATAPARAPETIEEEPEDEGESE